MKIIDAKWIRSRLKATGTTQVRLAEAMRISPDKLAKILASNRRIKAEEAARALDYFGEGKITAEEEALLEAWRRAPAERRAAAVELLNFLAHRAENE